MRSIVKPPSILPRIVFLAVALLVASAGVIATLAAAGVIELPFMKGTPQRSTAGLVPVPMTGQPIPRYTKVTRDFFYDPKTQKPQVVYLRPDQVKPGMLVKVSDILGRVTNHEKPAGYVFMESDFLPKGTRPGLVAGIPHGKVALDIEADKIRGIQAVQAGDHFDLVSSLVLDTQKKQVRPLSIVPIGMPPQQLKKVAVDLLVQDGVVVSPMTDRKIITGPPSYRTGIPPSKIVHEVVLAVNPDEVDGLMEALALQANVDCFARSGRPEDPATSTMTAGRVAVPVAARPVPSYTQVTRETFISPRTRKPQVVYLRPEDVPPGALAQMDQILGRVTSQELPAGHIFTSEDLLPRGTRPGMAGGIPPGMRAVELDAARIKGIYSLRAGDHFDLIASVPVDINKNLARNVVVNPGSFPPMSQKRVAVEVVVHYGVIVSPVTTKFLQTGLPFTEAADKSTKTIQEVVIAIAPKEAALLSGALALKAELTCVVRSGRPDDPGSASVTPGIRLPKVQTIEIINGKQRRFFQFQDEALPGVLGEGPPNETGPATKP